MGTSVEMPWIVLQCHVPGCCRHPAPACWLQDVRSNPWAAQRYFAEAECLEAESIETAADTGERRVLPSCLLR